ncbi:MAG TPA: FMN-binding glutamate synthase family protein [Frankiaceae bacterium]|nr:FMN-binding glutamate synthase family protein [Frankiaceae bacterium]
MDEGQTEHKGDAVRKWAAVGGLLAPVVATAVHDLLQRKHAVIRNYPVVGHLRFLLERAGPELRQYIIASNDAERPFSRDQRRWVYASAKLENNYFGFGSDNDMENEAGFVLIRHSTLGTANATTPAVNPHDAWLPSAKVLGRARGRRHPFRPNSIVNISGMSFGALSGPAVQALNRGAALAGCMQNTGEGGLSDHHRQGGDLVFQLGTAYFGCRDAQGRFDLEQLCDLVTSAPVQAIEIKLSQGAKPGLGGMLPGTKVSKAIAEARHIAVGEDCLSPSRHREFADVDSMLDFVERVADATGLPVGIKSAVGDLSFWRELCARMSAEDRGVDFVTIDGGEGGTGAAPLVFTDHVSMPFRHGFAQVYRVFAEAGLTDDVVFVGSGKLGLPDNALVAFALGADLVSVGREAMLSIGCIQAQKCHTDTCPTGVATQNAWLTRGLDPELKSVRCANYLTMLRRDLQRVSQSCGVDHPAMVTTAHMELLEGLRSTSLRDVFNYDPAWGLPSPDDLLELRKLLADHQPG